MKKTLKNYLSNYNFEYSWILKLWKKEDDNKFFLLIIAPNNDWSKLNFLKKIASLFNIKYQFAYWDKILIELDLVEIYDDSGIENGLLIYSHESMVEIDDFSIHIIDDLQELNIEVNEIKITVRFTDSTVKIIEHDINIPLDD